MIKVFMGGTLPGYDWRKLLKEMADGSKIEFLNPVVPVWTDEARENERLKRESSDFVLYVITPYMHGVYSIAEAVDDSNKRPEKTLFCVLQSRSEDKKVYSPRQWRSLLETMELIRKNGAEVFNSLEAICVYLLERAL
jgi:hypothetical protein